MIPYLKTLVPTTTSGASTAGQLLAALHPEILADQLPTCNEEQHSLFYSDWTVAEIKLQRIAVKERRHVSAGRYCYNGPAPSKEKPLTELQIKVRDLKGLM